MSKYLELLTSDLKKQSLKQMLRKQLSKDLNISMESIPEGGALLNWLSTFLNNCAFSEHDLAQLLYTIDVDQNKVPHSFTNQDLAQCILEREAQKVYFKAQYSGLI